MTKIKLIFLCFFLAGCASSLDRYSANGGVLNAHFLTGTYSSVEERAQSYCENRSMKIGSITKISTGCPVLCGSEFSKFEFSCVQYDSQSSTENLHNASSSALEKAKFECQSLGFKQGTEAFGNCVLKLIENKSTAVISNSTSTQLKQSDRGSRDNLYLEQERQRLLEEKNQRKALEEISNEFNKQNRKAMCQSWGNQYCD